MPSQFRAGACGDAVDVVVAIATRGHSSAGQSIGLRTRSPRVETSLVARSRAGKLTTAQVVEIRELRHDGELNSSEIATLFGVSQSLVCQISTGRLWTSAPGPITRVNRPEESREERLTALTDRSGGVGACWPFCGSRDANGYGRITHGGRSIGAHVAALESKLDRELGDDEVARHDCDNPPCCNPDHLVPGSVLDNNHDAIARGRNAKQLTDDQVEAIRSEAGALGWGCRVALGKKYGVSGQHIGRIVRRRARVLAAAKAVSP